MLDVLNIAKRQEDRPDGLVSFEVEPDELYPQAIADLREEVKKDKKPTEIEGWLLQHYQRAKKIAEADWEAALKSKEECPPELIAGRTEALEVARLWFTAKLHKVVDNVPMHLHILKGEKWRL